MIRERQLLPSEKNITSTDQDFHIKLELESNERLLKDSENISILNLDQQFITDRKNSDQYRVYGKISLMTYDENTKVTNINTFSSDNDIEREENLKQFGIINFSGNVIV
ncbi:MAG: hypothetical protein IIB83_02945 [Bacteroidetes bacterium]|nr:hypothetical protein [Bacteroidota bacterium]